ncbi:MAG: putative lipase [Frankiales bacterium]|nr:putative lipase [Frankiales bacterium]
MTLPYAQPSDLDHMIENDFAIVERQFQHIENSTASVRVRVDQIGFELALHSCAIEQVLYPVFEEDGQARDLEQAREPNETPRGAARQDCPTSARCSGSTSTRNAATSR